MLSIFLIGIALSMDAFSIALTFGINRLSKVKSILFPFIVSIMHFVMPLLGNYLGNELLNIININSRILMVIIFIYLIIVMLLDKENKQYIINNLLSIVIISFSVSIDSFTVGIGISGLTNHMILSFIVFSICSGSFTTIGLIIGKYSNKYLGRKAKYLGIIIMIILVIVNICKIIGI